MFETCRREDIEPDDGSAALSPLWTYIEEFVAQGTAVKNPQRSLALCRQAKEEERAGEPWVDFLLEVAHAYTFLGADDLPAALEGQVEPARQFLAAAAALDTGSIPILRVFREPHPRALGSSSGELDHDELGWIDPENLAVLIDAAICHQAATRSAVIA